LYEELRREAYEKRMSLAAVIRMRLENRPAAPAPPPVAAPTDPLLAIAGLADAGTLTENLDGDLYEI
jgi:hypothetical protein